MSAFIASCDISSPATRKESTNTVPFEYQGDDEVWVHLHPPVALLPGRVGLRVVGGQDDPRGPGQVPSARRCRGGERHAVSGSSSETARGVIKLT